MAVVEILSGDLKARLEVARLLQALGHQPLHAADLEDFKDLQGRIPPEVLLTLEPADGPSPWVAQVRQAAPSLPLIVCLSRRDAERAVEYLKLGAAECLAPPLTREALSAGVRKALRLKGTVLELADLPPEPRRAPRRLKVAALAAGLGLLAGLAVVFLVGRRAPEPSRTWDLPYLHPAGVAVGGDSAWIGDWYSQSVYEHAPETMAVRRVRSFPQEPPVALALAEGALWIASGDGRVVKHQLDAKLTALGRFRLPGRGTSGLCYDGLYLWSSDRQARLLRQHLPDEKLTVVQEFAYPGSAPAAIACDQRALWSIDEKKGESLRHNLADPTEVADRLPLQAYSGGIWRPAGLAVAGGRLWSVAELAAGGRAVLIRHSESESLQP